MRIAIAGATGVLGRNLIPLLSARGHTMRALVRTPASAPWLAEAGVEMVQGDLLDPDITPRLSGMLAGCDAAAHIATAIPRDMGAPGAWEATAPLRTEGTARLLAAARAAGVRRYVQQSIVMAYPDGGDGWLDETTPLDTTPARAAVCGPVIAMEGLVRAVPVGELAWCILRGGAFVGPGTAQDALRDRLRAGTETVPCDGRAWLSPIHVADMAAAVALALEHAPGGSIYNIVDAPLRQGAYLDRLAALLGAPPPPRDPSRPCPPSFRCAHQAARTGLGWAPAHSIWPAVG
jgi:nucleoside-diphosphate-sugar epimerase